MHAVHTLVCLCTFDPRDPFCSETDVADTFVRARTNHDSYLIFRVPQIPT